MECSNVQLERPSCSTSGGQSGGGAREDREDVVCAGDVVVDIVDGDEVSCLAIAAHAPNEVHERQL